MTEFALLLRDSLVVPSFIVGVTVTLNGLTVVV